MTRTPSYYDVLSAAIEDLQKHGYDDPKRVAYWQRRIKEAAERMLLPQSQMVQKLNRSMRQIYTRLIDRGDVLKMAPGVQRWTLAKLKPQLHAELERRIMASAELIRLNRDAEIQKTLQRFSGWAVSIPAGGSKAVDKKKEREELRKPMQSLPFRERRVLVDQGHKLVASISEIVATDSGAIAGIWRSHWREANYDYREDHKERDGEVYVVRDNWAITKGLMKTSGHEYTDDITQPGEDVFCRCWYKWIFNLRDLPPDMLTEKGRKSLAAIAA